MNVNATAEASKRKAGTFCMIPHAIVDAGLSTNELAVLVVIARHANKAGECHPGIERIAKRAGMSRTTAKSAIRSLQSRGLLSVTPRRDDSGDHATHLYRLLWVGRNLTEVGQTATEGRPDSNRGGRSNGDREGRSESDHEVDTVLEVDTVQEDKKKNVNVDVDDNGNASHSFEEERQDKPRKKMTAEQRQQRLQEAFDKLRETYPKVIDGEAFKKRLKPIPDKWIDPLATITGNELYKVDAMAEWLRKQAAAKRPLFEPSAGMLFVLWAIAKQCTRRNITNPAGKFVAIIAARSIEVAAKTIPTTGDEVARYLTLLDAKHWEEEATPTGLPEPEPLPERDVPF